MQAGKSYGGTLSTSRRSGRSRKTLSTTSTWTEPFSTRSDANGSWNALTVPRSTADGSFHALASQHDATRLLSKVWVTSVVMSIIRPSGHNTV